MDQSAGTAEIGFDFRVGDWPMHGLLAIVRCHLRNMGIVLEPFDISPVKWRLLSILAERRHCTVGKLAEVSVVERSNVSRIVDAMAQEGLISKDVQGRDRRQTVIAMTGKGETVFAESVAVVLDYYEQFFRNVSEQDRKVFMKTLDVIERNVCGVAFELEKRSGRIDN